LRDNSERLAKVLQIDLADVDVIDDNGTFMRMLDGFVHIGCSIYYLLMAHTSETVPAVCLTFLLLFFQLSPLSLQATVCVTKRLKMSTLKNFTYTDGEGDTLQSEVQVVSIPKLQIVEFYLSK